MDPIVFQTKWRTEVITLDELADPGRLAVLRRVWTTHRIPRRVTSLATG